MRHTLDGVACDAVPAELALYPYGCFTSFVVERDGVLGLDRHLDRLSEGAQQMWGARVDRDHVLRLLRDHVACAPTCPCSVRVTLYPSAFDLAAPERAHGYQVLISSRTADLPRPAATSTSVRTVQLRRDSPELKTTGLTAQIRVRREARLAGADDALLVDGDRVLEGATWSVIALTDGTARTPDGDVLASVTVQAILDALQAAGWTVRRGPLTVSALESAQLVIAVNANRPAAAIERIDGRALAVDRRLLSMVTQLYASLARTQIGPLSG